VVKGDVRGIGLTIIDTPGLHASSDMALSNRGILRSIGRAYKKHKPDFVIYVDRCDPRSRFARPPAPPPALTPSLLTRHSRGIDEAAGL
jgi:hypothetical protein